MHTPFAVVAPETVSDDAPPQSTGDEVGGRAFACVFFFKQKTAYEMMNKEPRPTRRTPQWLRRSNSSPDNRMAAEGAENGAFSPRENAKLTRPIREEQAPPEPRLALSTVIDQTINVMDEREEQRHNLINTLLIV